MKRPRLRVLYLVTEDWYFLSHRLSLARAARDAGYEVVVATRVREGEARISAEGFRVAPLKLRRSSLTPWAELMALIQIVGIYRRERPDVAHHVAIKPIIYGSIAARLSGVGTVVNAFAGLGFSFVGGGARGFLYRELLRLLFMVSGAARAAVLVQNSDDRDLLRRHGFKHASIDVIGGSGVDIQHYQPQPSQRDSAPGEGFTVGCYVGRMLWHKGVGELVEAARLLKGTHPRLRLWLVGLPDPENPASIPQAQLEAWDAEGVVKWKGHQSDIRSVWAAADLAILPSYREGVPKALLEAGACGRALIACDAPGSREVVIHQVTGLLVPPRDGPALAGAIAQLLDDPDYRGELGRRARERVESHFSESRITHETLRLYHVLQT